MTFIYKLFIVWEEHAVCNVTGFRSAASNTSFILFAVGVACHVVVGWLKVCTSC